MKKNTWCPDVLLESFMLMLTIGILYGCGNNDLIEVINEPTYVLAAPSAQEYEIGSSGPKDVIAVLKKGETAEVIGQVNAKAYMAYKVRLSDGRTGYIINDRHKIQVVHR
jgi:hypothetical protein